MAIARSLGASFVALYGPDRVRFDTTGLLEPVHEEEEARVYRIVVRATSPNGATTEQRLPVVANR